MPVVYLPFISNIERKDVFSKNVAPINIKIIFRICGALYLGTKINDSGDLQWRNPMDTNNTEQHMARIRAKLGRLL